jgi:hypothetical protein
VNKRGVELAANFLVILIISVILFGLASGLTYKIICSSEKKIDQLDESSDRVIEQKLNSGANVQVPVNIKNVNSGASFCGERGRGGASFTLGIRNDLDTLVELNLKCIYRGTEADNYGLSDNCDDWQFDATKEGTYALAAREKIPALTVFTVPAGVTAGKHMFTLRVQRPDDSLYGASNVYIVVK